MKKMLILGIAAGLLCASAAYAYPTLAGPTGNAVLPTACVVPAGEFNIAADYYNTSNSDIDSKSSYPIRALYGVIPGLEIGAGYTFQDIGGESANNWNVNAKYAMPVNKLFTAALGARYGQTMTSPNINATDVYLAGTYALAMGKDMPTLNATIGVDWEQQQIPEFTNSGFRGFIGVEATVYDKLSLAAEYQTLDGNLDLNSLYSFVARYPFTDMISAQLGYTNYANVGFAGGENGKFFVGVNLAFGGATE